MKKLFESWRNVCSDYNKKVLKELQREEDEAAAVESPIGHFKSDQYEKYVSWLGNNAKDPKVATFLNYGLSKYDGSEDDDAFSIKTVAIPVVKLKPTQNEIGIEGSLKWPIKKNPKQFIQYAGATKPVTPPSGPGKTDPIVTFDGQWVIDGHHRWSTLYACNAGASIVCNNITANFKLGPIGMLKTVQAAIAREVGGIPQESASGANLLTAGEEEVKGWIDANMNPKLPAMVGASPEVSAKVFGVKTKKEQPVTEAEDSTLAWSSETAAQSEAGEGVGSDVVGRTAIANYVWKNVRVIQQNAKPPKGAPARDFMPQTGNAPNWVNTLTQGAIDLAPPYAKTKGAVSENKKITRSALKKIIREELTKAEKKRKKKLKSELDDLEHK